MLFVISDKTTTTAGLYEMVQSGDNALREEGSDDDDDDEEVCGMYWV